MPSPDYSTLVNSQREYFVSGCTRSSSWRKKQLETLKTMFTENRDELCGALWKDLRRNTVDADLMDVAYIVNEAEYALKHLDKWMAPEKVLRAKATRLRLWYPGCDFQRWRLQSLVLQAEYTAIWSLPTTGIGKH
jgi:acyl-CoA reductase-like NAD-dependent aldehyde dehydrogenase